MGRFRVDPPKLAEAVTQMQAFHAVVQASVAEAQAVMAKLSGSWDGEAAAKAQRVHQQLRSGSEEMGRALAGLKGFLDGAHGAYLGAITGNSQMWGVDQAR